MIRTMEYQTVHDWEWAWADSEASINAARRYRNLRAWMTSRRLRMGRR